MLFRSLAGVVRFILGRNRFLKKYLLFIISVYFLQRNLFKELGFSGGIWYNLILNKLYLLKHLKKKNYNVLKFCEVKKTRKSDRVFIFGCGRSLNDLLPEEWSKFSHDDTLGFSAFVYQKWIPIRYHLLRGWGEGANITYDHHHAGKNFSSITFQESFFKETIFLLQDEYQAHFCNALVRYSYLPNQSKILFYKTAFPSELTADFSLGLVHKISILSDAISFAYCMGWREIVLVGVDLYNSGYFWLNEGETICNDYATGRHIISEITDRGCKFNEPHSTVYNGIVELLRGWERKFKNEGVSLTVYNPKSLLSSVLRIYDR